MAKVKLQCHSMFTFTNVYIWLYMAVQWFCLSGVEGIVDKLNKDVYEIMYLI